MILPFMPLYIDDYEAATAHLSMLEDGAYSRLLRLCWRSPGCKLPHDMPWIMRKMRAHTDAEQAAVGAVLAEFFTTGRGQIWSKRLLSEHVAKSVAHLKRKDAGKSGGLAKAAKAKEKRPSNAEAMLYQPEPEPYSKKESATHSCAMGSETAVFEAPKAARFDEFWTAYPHRGGVKRGKKPAEAKYTAAVRAGVPEQSIIDGAHRARGDPNVQRGYARDPATWLNQAGWEDDIPDQTAALLPFPSREEARREKRHDDLQRIIAAAARGTT